jgi:phosphoribosyl-ATP pyrophosphohydrolase/phosphoribosyl-AMP cyclohydrolase
MIKSEHIDWQKTGGLIPAIVQDARTRCVLMLGYMNEEAFLKTQETGHVTFFSRTKQRLWVKGETSGNYLELEGMKLDCDGDTLLVAARPVGPVCHTGAETCFDEKNEADFLDELEQIIDTRRAAGAKESYVAGLMKAGLSRMAQKVGEEGVEVALAGTEKDRSKLREESADLLFHLLVLLRASGLGLADIRETLKARHKK